CQGDRTAKQAHETDCPYKANDECGHRRNCSPQASKRKKENGKAQRRGNGGKQEHIAKHASDPSGVDDWDPSYKDFVSVRFGLGDSFDLFGYSAGLGFAQRLEEHINRGGPAVRRDVVTNIERIAGNFLFELCKFRGGKLISSASINQASDADACPVPSYRFDVCKTHRLIDAG